MFTWKRFILVCCTLILSIFLFTYLILPGIVRDQAQKWVAENTGRNLEIGSISINPINLEVEVRQLALSEQDHSQRFLSWDVLRVGLSPKSLTQRAPIIRELYLQKPHVHIEKLPVEEMEKLLYANTTVDQDTLGQLALARAVAVQNYLTMTAGLAKERVFLTRPAITATPDQKGAIQARVELGTTVN